MLIETLERHSGLHRRQLERYALSASKMYKVYRIRKRNGGKRVIEHPSKELKSIQRWLNGYLFRRFPVHENATAYKKNTNIQRNAERHAKTRFTLRLDFSNFFPSFSIECIGAYIANHDISTSMGLNDADLNFLCSIVTRNERLTVGSPSSPILSNLMMYDFDNIASEFSLKNQLVYTRYADDLFFSSNQPNGLDEVEEFVGNALKKYPHVTLKLNSDKTTYLSRRYKRTITGLVITPDQKVSLGRDRKREIRTLVYKYLKGELDLLQRDRLRGLLGFAMDAEIGFFNSLIRKYGDEALRTIQGPDIEQGKAKDNLQIDTPPNNAVDDDLPF